MVVYWCTWSVKYARRTYCALPVPSPIWNGAMSKHEANLIILIHLVDFTDDWTEVGIFLSLQSKESNWFKSPALNRNIDLTGRVSHKFWGSGKQLEQQTNSSILCELQPVQVSEEITRHADPEKWRHHSKWKHLLFDFIWFESLYREIKVNRIPNAALVTCLLFSVNIFFPCSRVAGSLFWSWK